MSIMIVREQISNNNLLLMSHLTYINQLLQQSSFPSHVVIPNMATYRNTNTLFSLPKKKQIHYSCNCYNNQPLLKNLARFS